MFKSKRTKYIFIFALSVFLLFGLKSAFAQADLGMNDAADIGLPQGSTTDPKLLIINIIRFVLGFLGLIATIIILYGGWLWMTSAGDPLRVEKAKKTLIAAIIGIVIIISAFAIVTFIAHLVQDTLNFSGNNGCVSPTPYNCSGVCSATPCNTFVGGGNSFLLRSVYPKPNSTGQPRNVVIKGFMNRPANSSVTDAVLQNNVRVERMGDIDEITGTFTPGAATIVVGSASLSPNRDVINFSADASCQDEKNTPHCLSSWSRYQVTINGSSGIIDSSSRPLECTLSGPCVFTFDTNNLIDTAGPTAGMVRTQICQGMPAQIGGWGRDDIAISSLDFSFDGAAMANFAGSGERYQYEEFEFDTSSLAIGSDHIYSIQVEDGAGQIGNANYTATTRAGHCCNGVRDADEEDIDCGGSCDSCNLMDPIILNISPDNGASGNFITIAGRHFGTAGGRVYFTGNDGNMTVLADFPNSSDCPSNWQDNQIIVIVPEGAITAPGPIRIQRADNNKEDTTAIDSPPQINFTRNNTIRPGLCSVSPEQQGFFNDLRTYHGVNFVQSGGSVRFGSNVDYFSANNIGNWTNSSVNAQVPNITRGRTTTYVVANTENSNPLYFSVLQDSNNNPIIDFIDPDNGPSGQYITIYGSGFGNYQAAVSKVIFSGPGGNIGAAIDFPGACQDNWWHNEYIIVKVPNTNNGSYQVTITNGANNSSDPEDFEIITGDPKPGICALEPHNGPIGTVVDIFGDNFGNSAGQIRFSSNLLTNSSEWANQGIRTAVPVNAVTGPVRVENNGTTSNSLPFTVGSCTSSNDCELSEDCCTSGLWRGICRPQNTCSQGYFDTAFGWIMTTGQSSSGGQPCYDGGIAGSCDINLSICDQSQGWQCNVATCLCEQNTINQDGSCQGKAERTNACDLAACPNSPGLCSPYTSSSDVPTGENCSLNCIDVAGCMSGPNSLCEYREETDTCFIPDSNHAHCTDSTITDMFGRNLTASCITNGATSNWQIVTPSSCPTGWVRSGLNICIGQTCSPCPSNFSCRNIDSDLEGECVANADVCLNNSVCRNLNGTEQCVTSGKSYCDCCCRIGQDNEDCCAPLICEGNCGSDASGNDTNSYGHCSGCASVGSTQSDHDLACNCTGNTGKFCDTSVGSGVCVDCSSINNAIECSNHTACCFDAITQKCEGGRDRVGVPGGLQYCAYYDCDTNTTTCAQTSMGALGEYKTNSGCSSVCSTINGTNAGQLCLSSGGCNIGVDTCGSILHCMDNGTTDCRCCCDPNTAGSCPIGLQCLAGTGYCTGTNRGSCCGCTSDSQCSNGADGCGADTCCSARPQISAVLPADMTTGVCRNPLIQASTTQPMDIASFSDNMILLGDYNNSTCPAGTTYLTLGEPKNQKGLFAKIKNILIKAITMVLPKETALAQQFVPQAGRTYCAIPGKTYGYNNAAGNGIMQFSPKIALDPMRVYFAIIKGDKDLNDSIKEGILSKLKIGMNGPNDADNVFNGITYNNSYIWAFQTGTDICALDHVTINPGSYLFSRPNYTQAFIAEPRSSGNQIISAISGVYEWSWNWRTDNSSVVTVSHDPAAIASEENVTSQNVQDAKTVVSATASITINTLGNVASQSRIGRADVYVFLCENPWPPRSADGTWSPWQDNCPGGLVNCSNFNHELYYCRDSGKAGTYDDLPALLSDQAVIRGSSANVLKEVYFFRERMSEATTTMSLVNDNTGDSITVNWNAINNPNLRNYRIYIGAQSGAYAQHYDAPSTATTFPITGLINNTRYYIKITAIYTNNVETDIANGSITPTDTTDPAAPSSFRAATTTVSGEIQFNWNKVSDANAYRIYYGTAPNSYGMSQNLSDIDQVILSGFNSNNTYYFSIAAIDKAGNESEKSSEAVCTPIICTPQ